MEVDLEEGCGLYMLYCGGEYGLDALGEKGPIISPHK